MNTNRNRKMFAITLLVLFVIGLLSGLHTTNPNPVTAESAKVESVYNQAQNQPLSHCIGSALTINERYTFFCVVPPAEVATEQRTSTESQSEIRDEVQRENDDTVVITPPTTVPPVVPPVIVDVPDNTHHDNGNHYGNDKPDNNQHDTKNKHNGEQSKSDHHDNNGNGKSKNK